MILKILLLPGEGNGNPFQYSCLENPMDGGAWSLWGLKESDTTERLHFHFHLSIFWHCLSFRLEWKLTFSSPVATAAFSKFSGILSASYKKATAITCVLCLSIQLYIVIESHLYYGWWNGLPDFFFFHMVGKDNPLFVSKTERFSLCSRDHPQKPLVSSGISQNLKFLLVPDSISDFNIYLLYDLPAPKWSWVSSGECSSSRMYLN